MLCFMSILFTNESACGYKQKSTRVFVRYHKNPLAQKQGVRLFCEMHSKNSFAYKYLIA